MKPNPARFGAEQAPRGLAGSFLFTTLRPLGLALPPGAQQTACAVLEALSIGGDVTFLTFVFKRRAGTGEGRVTLGYNSVCV